MVVLQGSLAELCDSYRMLCFDDRYGKLGAVGQAIHTFVETDSLHRDVYQGDTSFVKEVERHKDTFLSFQHVTTLTGIKVDEVYDRSISTLVSELNSVGMGVPLLPWDYTTRGLKESQSKARIIGAASLAASVPFALLIHPVVAVPAMFGFWEGVYGFSERNAKRVKNLYGHLHYTAEQADQFLSSLDLNHIRRSE